jgi:hypothetical protein
MRRFASFSGMLLAVAMVLSLAGTSFGRTTPSNKANIFSNVHGTAVVSSWVGDPIVSAFDKNKKKKGGGNGNMAVPEGGSALMYLSLAGLTCLGAALVVGYRKKYSGANVRS